jgi:hypothetical protein
VCRSNLCHIGINRFETTCIFCQDITELVLNVALGHPIFSETCGDILRLLWST